MNILNLRGRKETPFSVDIAKSSQKLKETVSSSSFLVLGGAGSIG